jgi:hypothetical protein
MGPLVRRTRASEHPPQLDRDDRGRGRTQSGACRECGQESTLARHAGVTPRARSGPLHAGSLRMRGGALVRQDRHRRRRRSRQRRVLVGNHDRRSEEPGRAEPDPGEQPCLADRDDGLGRERHAHRVQVGDRPGLPPRHSGRLRQHDDRRNPGLGVRRSGQPLCERNPTRAASPP